MSNYFHANYDGSIEIDATHSPLSNKRSLEVVKEAFEANSHQVNYHSIELGIMLFNISIANETKKYYVAIKNICKGGRNNRQNEQRIQPTGDLCNKLIELKNEGKDVLLLGIYERNNIPIIVAWKPETSGTSGPVSKFIDIENIAEAMKIGFSQYQYNQATFVCAFRKEFIYYYINNIDILHSQISGDSRINLSTIAQNPIPAGSIDKPYNRIIFGAPGTGKSYALEHERQVFGDNYERVTFYPNYSYAQFVGTYKPVPLGNNPSDITYEYVQGPFLRLLIQSINNPNDNYLLIIEEINRANVAAVFGDIFQLLDRDAGRSKYPISTSEDMRKHLSRELGGAESYYETLELPDNFYIWSTMNSADQGIFPLDAAFKRRWSFEFLDINENENIVIGNILTLKNGKQIEWNDLRKSINKKLSELKVNEDQLIGPFFLSDEEIKEENFNTSFKNKLLMYLYQDVLKHKRGFFNEEYSTYSELLKAYSDYGGHVFNFDLNYIEEDEGQQRETEVTVDQGE